MLSPWTFELNQTRREAEVAGKLPQALEKKLDPSKLVIPKLPDLRINTEDFNDPWHAHSNAKGKGRASRHSDSILDSNASFNQAEHVDWDFNEMEGNGEHDLHSSEFGGDDDGDGHAPTLRWSPTSGLHSRHPSVTPLPQSPSSESATLDLPDGQDSINLQSTLGQPASLRPLPTGHQGSVQPHLPPSRQGSVQPRLHHNHQLMVQASTQSRQGSVNPPSHTMDPYELQDDALIYEQSHINAQVSKKRPYRSVGGSNGPKAKRKAKQAPQTPVRPLRETAGPSTGTRSQVRWTNPMIISTDATPGPGASGNRHVTALYLNDDVENEDT